MSTYYITLLKCECQLDLLYNSLLESEIFHFTQIWIWAHKIWPRARSSRSMAATLYQIFKMKGVVFFSANYVELSNVDSSVCSLIEFIRLLTAAPKSIYDIVTGCCIYIMDETEAAGDNLMHTDCHVQHVLQRKRQSSWDHNKRLNIYTLCRRIFSLSVLSTDVMWFSSTGLTFISLNMGIILIPY